VDRREFLQASMLALADITRPALWPTVSAQDSNSEAEIYVALSGSNEDPGTRQAPFASLERAKLEVRERKRRIRGPITVWVRGGTLYHSAIATALGVSLYYAMDIRRGRRCPHPRHWLSLATLSGFDTALSD